MEQVISMPVLLIVVDRLMFLNLGFGKPTLRGKLSLNSSQKARSIKKSKRRNVLFVLCCDANHLVVAVVVKPVHLKSGDKRKNFNSSSLISECESVFKARFFLHFHYSRKII